MRTYADSSFILRLVTRDEATTPTIDEYRRLDRPALFFLPLHDLEVRTGILQRAFFQKRSVSSEDRRNFRDQRDAAFARFEMLIDRRTLVAVSVDADMVFARAVRLSVAHTEQTGARSLDLLHVASALELETEMFLTADARQAKIAKAEGLKTVLVE